MKQDKEQLLIIEGIVKEEDRERSNNVSETIYVIQSIKDEKGRENK